MKRVTIKDIASHLCLSASTVSRALADDRNIRRDTKDLVAKAADELGYRRNRLAVSLRSGRTNIIGVVVDHMVDESTMSILAGAERLLHSRGINMMVANSEGNCQRERDNLLMMHDAQVDGMVVVMCDPEKNSSVFLHLKKWGMPLVFLNVLPHCVIASSVCHQNPDAGVSDFVALGEKGAELVLRIVSNPAMPTENLVLD